MTKHTQTDQPDRKAGRKYAQVLEGARKVFLSDGFGGASVDEIARVAGVSKATLYSYFPDKRLLFIEMARSECARTADASVDLGNEDLAPKEVLSAAGHHILSLALSEFHLKMFRICLSEADRFPDLAREFYESGPLKVRRHLRSYLETGVARGQLVIDDLDLAADQFAALCQADLPSRFMFNIDSSFTEAECARVVDAAVEVFLTRYSV